MISIVENSNICDVKEGLILQGVNCQGVMGSGVAKQLRAKYPNIFRSYAHTCAQFFNAPEDLLGTVDYFQPKYGVELYIANCFTQEYYGKDGKKYASYDALAQCLETVKELCNKSNLAIHIPYLIGVGLGGLKEKIVLAMIEEILAKHTVYLHRFNK